MGLSTDLGAWSLDEACLVAGRTIEKLVNEGKDPFSDQLADGSRNFRSAKGAGRRIKKKKIKADGTW
jgi:hypothetical protein